MSSRKDKQRDLMNQDTLPDFSAIAKTITIGSLYEHYKGLRYKIRLNRLEKVGTGDRLWALIGIGKPRDAQHQKILEIQARKSFMLLEVIESHT